jgi:transposase
MSCEAVARVLSLDEDTIRTWYRLYEQDGVDGRAAFSGGGSAPLCQAQQDQLRAWISATLPRNTRAVLRRFHPSRADISAHRRSQNRLTLCDHVSDNVRIIQPQDFRVVN